MTQLILIDLAGTREVREVPEEFFVVTVPNVIVLDSRPWVRRTVDRRLMVYQEVSFSSLDPQTKVHPRQEDCANAETENRNLRAILADVAAAAPSLRELIAERLDRHLTLEDGGVTADGAEDAREVIRELIEAAGKLADMAEEASGQKSIEGLNGAQLYEQCRTVRSKVTEVEDALPPSLHEARAPA